MKIKVPEFMLTASIACGPLQIHREYRRNILEAALRALAENPIVPTEEQRTSFYREWNDPASPISSDYAMYAITWWQRIMFLEPAEKVSEEELKGMERAAALLENRKFDYPEDAIRNKISELRKEGN